MDQAKKVFTDVTFCDSAYQCATGAHALVIVTEWAQFRALDLKEMATIMACSVIVDLRNIYSPDEVQREGFLYCGVGRPQAVAY
jgi:UDPglucose 6-dehydrogenase